MTTLRFTQANWPTADEFQRMVQETLAKSNPVDDLLEIAAELQEMEQKHNISSSEFYARYQHGEMGDDQEIIHWAATYHCFLELKQQVEMALMREAIYREADLVPA